MKTSYNLLLILALVFGPNAFALPILNLNAPGAAENTVFPDHLDKNLYYIAPTVMLVANDENGLPQFSYVEFGELFQPKGAIIQTTMRAHFPEEEIQATERQILAQNPAARFTGLPFFTSKVIFGDKVLAPLIVESSCDHPADAAVWANQAITIITFLPKQQRGPCRM